MSHTLCHYFIYFYLSIFIHVEIIIVQIVMSVFNYRSVSITAYCIYYKYDNYFCSFLQLLICSVLLISCLLS